LSQSPNLDRPATPAWGDLERAAALVLVVVALALRVWQLDTVPPGLSHDEAYDALNAVEILRGARPLFFESNNGREPLFMYLVAPVFGLLGPGVVQLRLVSALAGAAAAGMTLLLGRALFGRLEGWIAGVLVAVSFWPIFESRLGLRAVLIPPLVALMAYALWRWRCSGQIGWAAVAGGALGLALDTYTPSRFAPLVPLLFVAHVAFWRLVPIRRALIGLVAATAVAALLFAPLALYFLSHPGSFTGRADQVNDLRFILQSGDIRPLVEDSLNTLMMFTVVGDQSMRYNLADRPVFDLATGLFFYAGAVALLRRLRFGDAAAALALIGLVVGLLPSAITGESPHFLRAIGAQPFVFLLAAVGLGALARGTLLTAQLAQRAVLLVVALGALLSMRDYFLVWPDQRQGREIYGAQMAAVATELDNGLPAGRIFVSAEYPRDLDRFVLDLQSGLRPSDVTWYDGRIALPISTEGRSTYLVSANARPPLAVADQLGIVPGGGDVDRIDVPRPPGLTPSTRTSVRVGDALELIGYDLPEAALPGEVARVALYWRVLAQPPDDVALFVHAVGNLGSQWAQMDGLGYPREGWRPGDLLIQWHDLQIPVGAPPVELQLEAGAYRRSDGQRLPAVANGRTDDRIRLGALPLVRPDEPPGLPENVERTSIPFGDRLRLRGVELDTTAARPGGALGVTLYWGSLAPVQDDYTVFVHLVGAAPQPVSQADGPPAYGMFPTSRWERGDVVRDPHEVALPPGLPPGRYTVLAGLYRRSDGARLAPTAAPVGLLDRLGSWLARRGIGSTGPRADGDRVSLGTVEVRPG
jgi:4-amino-4-deoxy-L-arabinose transferase-like glycosyltransferase